MNAPSYFLYALRDSKVEVHTPPFHARNDAAATRQFGVLVSDRSTQFGTHPEDFVLYRIAAVDEVSGEVVPDYVNIVSGRALLAMLSPASEDQTELNLTHRGESPDA